MEKQILVSKSDWHTGREFVQPVRIYRFLFLNFKLENLIPKTWRIQYFPDVGRERQLH